MRRESDSRTEQTRRRPSAGQRLRRRVSAGLFAASLAASGIAAVPAVAAPGELDLTFNGSGIANTDFNPEREDQGLAMAIQPDGKIVVVGATDKDTTPIPSGDPSTISVPINYDFAIIRDMPNGQLDTSFGTGGKVTESFGPLSETAFAVAVQPDGKILVGGVTFTGAGAADFAILRLLSDGGRDPNFGPDGRVTTSMSAGVDSIHSIAVQPDGKIVVAGVANCQEMGNCTAADTAVARYEADGDLDTSFSGDGKTTVDVGGGDQATAVAIQSDGSIVLAGNAVGSETDFSVVRLDPDGSLDTSFSGDGKVLTGFATGQVDVARSLAIQTDGRIVVGGVAGALSGTCPGAGCVLDENFGLVRYNANGSLDTGFGTGGKVTTEFAPTQPDAIQGITLLADGRIVAAGRTRKPTAPNARTFALVRYNTDGSVDGTFGAGGRVTTAVTADNNEASSVAVQPDGKIVAAGYAGIPGTLLNKVISVVRYQGDVPPLIPPGGGTTPPAGADAGYWLAASDGGIFAYGKAAFYGSTGNISLAQPIVGMAPTRSGKGYWLVASDGGIFAYGDAAFYGSTGNIKLNRPIVGMAPTPSGKGYWLVASDGGIFAYGDAVFHGSTGNITLAKPIVGMTPTSSGDGYWMVASDGGIFAYGDAVFHGSTGNITLAQPIVGMTATKSGGGYWMVASDGGIFAYGDAVFLGSTGNIKLAKPIIGMAAI